MIDGEIRDEEDTFNNDKETHKETMKGLTTRRRELSEVVKTGQERRPIRCEWKRDDKHKQWHLIRLDTGEVVQSETMALSDLQEKLPLEETKEAQENDKANNEEAGTVTGERCSQFPDYCAECSDAPRCERYNDPARDQREKRPKRKPAKKSSK
jgi:hypothetical protein